MSFSTRRSAVAVNYAERLMSPMDRQQVIALVLVLLMVGSLIGGLALI